MLDRAAPESYHNLPTRERCGDDLGLPFSELRLSPLLEKRRDRSAAALDQHDIGVEKAPAQHGCEQTSDGGFACSHETAQDHALCAQTELLLLVTRHLSR